MDPNTHGAMLVPVISGADKTTVSVATGQNDYHPFYFSLGNFQNPIRRSHCDAVLPAAFLAIPKGMSAIALTSTTDFIVYISIPHRGGNR